MNYEIKLNTVNSQNSNIKAFAALTFGDSFKVNNIAIIENRDGDLFVTMPSYKTNERNEKNVPIYKDICNPITAEFRSELCDSLIELYEEMAETGKKEASMRFNEDEELPYTVKVSPFERDDSNIKGFARIYFGDAFVVSNISILQGKETEFVAMPSHKTGKNDSKGKPEYVDICYPVTKEFRSELYGEILDTYRQDRENAVERGTDILQAQDKLDRNRPEREPVFR